MTRSRMVMIAAVAAVAVAGGGMAMTAADGFDPAKWREASGTTARDNPRSGMVSELRERLKPGMSRDEVVTLLGAPERDGGSRLSYSLGINPYGIDHEYFVIELDAGSRVRSFGITRG
jgi:hypothetical protein